MPETTRTTRKLSKETMEKLRKGTATKTIKKSKKPTTPKGKVSNVFTAYHVINVKMDPYLRFLFKNLHKHRIGQRFDSNDKDFKEIINSMIFEKALLFELIHKFTRLEKNVPIIKKIYMEILDEYKAKEDFYLSRAQEVILENLVFPKNYLPDEYGEGKKTKKANKKKDNKKNNTKKCVKIHLAPNIQFHEAAIYGLFVNRNTTKIKDKHYDVMMKNLQKYKPDASCVKFPHYLLETSKDVEVPFSMSLKDARKLVKKSK